MMVTLVSKSSFLDEISQSFQIGSICSKSIYCNCKISSETDEFFLIKLTYTLMKTCGMRHHFWARPLPDYDWRFLSRILMSNSFDASFPIW